MDVTTAFLNGEVNVRQPEGFTVEGKEHLDMQIREESIWTKTIAKMLELCT